MADVVLVDCKGTRNEGRKRMQNLGLGYLGAALEGKGHHVEILDANFCGCSTNDVIARVLGQRALLVGFSIFFNNTAESLEVARALRAQGFAGHITLGGHHATFYAVRILAEHPEVDSIVLGEGEEALTDLVERVAAHEEWRHLANLASRDGQGVVVRNACRPRARDLDLLARPLRRSYAQAIGDDKAASIISSRGCFGRCSFCSIHAFTRLAGGRPWRGRSAESVVQEIAHLSAAYGVRHVNFADDDFFGPGRYGKERALELARALRERQLPVTFVASCRPDNLDESVLTALKDAGLICLDIGVESWVPRQLAFYDKKVTVHQNWQAIALMRRLGIEFRVYLVPFDPHVTLQELAENMAAAQRVGIRHFLDMFTFNRILVFHGTVLEARLRRDGLLREASEGRDYEGELVYTFARPEVTELFARWHGIQPAYANLLDRSQDIARDEPTFSAGLLAANLRLALRQSVADLFQRFIAANLDSREAAYEMLPRAMAALDEAVAIVEDAKRRGALGRRLPVRFRIGSHTIDYPSPEEYAMSERLAAALLAGAEQ